MTTGYVCVCACVPSIIMGKQLYYTALNDNLVFSLI